MVSEKSITIHPVAQPRNLGIIFYFSFPYPTNMQGYTIYITNISQINPLLSFSMPTTLVQTAIILCLVEGNSLWVGLHVFIFVFSNTYSLQLLSYILNITLSLFCLYLTIIIDHDIWSSSFLTEYTRLFIFSWPNFIYHHFLLWL